MTEKDSFQEVAGIKQSIVVMNFLAILPIIYLIVVYSLSMFLVANRSQWVIRFNNDVDELILSIIFIFMNFWLIMGLLFSKFMIDNFPSDISPYQNLGKYFIVVLIAVQLPAIFLFFINFYAIFLMGVGINLIYNLIYTVIYVLLGYYFAMIYKNKIMSYYGPDYLNS